MLGTASIESEAFGDLKRGSKVRRVTWKLQSATTGGDGATVGSVEAAVSQNYSGYLKRVSIYPNRGAQPTDSFNVHIYDISASRDLNYGSIDLLASAGEGLTNSRPTLLLSSTPPLVGGKLVVEGNSMGDAKKTWVIAHIE